MTYSGLLLVLVTFTAGGDLLAGECYGQSPSSKEARVVAEGKALPVIDVIQGDRVITVLPKDAIPAIDNPRFVTADRATFLKPKESVIGVVSGRTAKAYSVWHLDRHEIVNDELGESPVAVTW